MNNIFEFNQINNNNNLFICPLVKNIEKDYYKNFNFNEFLIKEKNSDLFLIVFFYIKKIYVELKKLLKNFLIIKNKNLNYLNEEISCGKFIFLEKLKNVLKNKSIENKNLSFINNNNNHSNIHLNSINFQIEMEKIMKQIISNINNNNKTFYTMMKKFSLYKNHMKIIKNNIEKTNKEITKKINNLRNSNEFLENKKDGNYNNYYNLNKIPKNKN